MVKESKMAPCSYFGLPSSIVLVTGTGNAEHMKDYWGAVERDSYHSKGISLALPMFILRLPDTGSRYSRYFKMEFKGLA